MTKILWGETWPTQFHQVVFVVRIPEVTLKWLWTFRLSIISISCIWAESSAFSTCSFYWKFKIVSICNYNHHFIFKKAWEEFCRNFISYIWKSFELALINMYCNIAMKSVPAAPRSRFPIKMVECIFWFRSRLTDYF